MGGYKLKRIAIALRVMICAVAAMACQTESRAQEVQQHPTVALPAELDRVLRDYEKAWTTQDRTKRAAALAQLFAEDGYVLPDGHAPVKGRTAIRAQYTGQASPLALRAIAYGMEGNIAYIIGGYSRREGEPDRGKFTLTLRRGGDGRWLIISDMDNPNQRKIP